MNSKLSLFWGLLIFLTAGTLFCFSNNSFISAFYVFIAVFCGIFLIVFRKDIPVFSPIFMLISSIFINIGFPALYLFTQKVPFSEELIKNISVIYLIYFFSLIIPVFFANRIFTSSKSVSEKLTDLFRINFRTENINFYFIGCNVLIISLVFLLLKFTGFSYTEALHHPLAFRFAASAGSLAYARKLLIFLFLLNTSLLAKYNFSENFYKTENPLKLKVFTGFHIIILLLFTAISGSRSIIFLPVISSIAVYTFYNRLNLKTAGVFCVIFAFTLFLMSFYSIYRNNTKNFGINLLTGNDLSKTNFFTENLKRLDNFKNSIYFFEYIDRENNTLFYFKDFHISEQIKDHILQPFPRKLIPDKGYYFSSLMTAKVFNTDINESKITYNFGGISNAFWNFGTAGVILEGLLLGTAVVWLHRRFLKLINYDSFFMFFMVTFFFIPNSVIVDGFWNTMDGCGYFLNLLVLGVILSILSLKLKLRFIL